MPRPLITLLTDFGTEDHYVAAMKGVMRTISPAAEFVDISHQVHPWAIAEAAFTLSQAWEYFPKGTIHLIVVDPGVGSARRAIVAEAAGHRFVAPDNGVLTLAVAGRKPSVREITNRKYFSTVLSHTFHGRDLFAPVAAHLANRVPAAKLGAKIADWVRLESLLPHRDPRGAWHGTILKVDRFGNLITNLPSDLIEKERLSSATGWRVQVGRRSITALAASYSQGQPDKLFVIAGSSGYLEISLNQASAARLTGAQAGSPIMLKSAGGMS
ncbi:MAG TPA: SAM-dependent chlorinase/fluorinase [Bryobacteraceae bacterium]|nr:SAM-dependent chlorinase/fluorinase [Bryobacteraceae bacterium]